MADKKEKKKGGFLIKLLVVLIISLGIGFAISHFVGDKIPEEITGILLDKVGGDATIANTLICSIAMLFLCGMFWLFSLTKDSDGGTPKQMTRGDYDVNSDQKGSARWLNDKEIDQLFPKVAYDEAYKHDINGFVVQTRRIGNKTYANYKSEYHCLIIGSTGSGKTIRFVIPTMQLLGRSKAHPSIVVTDPKGELYASQTKLYKANGYDIISINLREGMKKSNCWNPCHMAYEEYQEALIQKDLIKRHTDKLDSHPKLKLAGDKGSFNQVWYEFGGYAFTNLRDAMIEAERNFWYKNVISPKYGAMPMLFQHEWMR